MLDNEQIAKYLEIAKAKTRKCQCFEYRSFVREWRSAFVWKVMILFLVLAVSQSFGILHDYQVRIWLCDLLACVRVDKNCYWWTIFRQLQQKCQSLTVFLNPTTTLMTLKFKSFTLCWNQCSWFGERLQNPKNWASHQTIHDLKLVHLRCFQNYNWSKILREFPTSAISFVANQW